jgi:predicted PhzF superfamily epimerase YddE/YHI9
VPTVQLPLDADIGTRRPHGPPHVYVQLDSQAAVAGVRPDFGALGQLGEIGVSCFAGAGANWKTRMFASGPGVQVEGGADGVRRVRVGGQAVLVARGEFRLG